MQRPQEALTAHAVDATLRTLNAVPRPGERDARRSWRSPPAMRSTTPSGTRCRSSWHCSTAAWCAPGSGGPGYEGVQALDWPDDIFWKPDGDRPRMARTFFRREFGFPHHPGLLERALPRIPRHRACAFRGCPASATTRRSTRASGVVTAGIARGAGRRQQAAAACRTASTTTGRSSCSPRSPRPSWPARPRGGRRPGPAADHQAGVRRGALPAGRAPGRARLHRPEPARRHRVLRPRHAGGPAHRAGHHLPRRAAPRGAWTTTRPGGWRPGWPKCIRCTGTRPAARCARDTTTGWWSCSPTTGSTR